MNDDSLVEEDMGIILSQESLDELFTIVSNWPIKLNTSKPTGPGCSIQEKLILGSKNNLVLGFDNERKKNLIIGVKIMVCHCIKNSHCLKYSIIWFI